MFVTNSMPVTGINTILTILLASGPGYSSRRPLRGSSDFIAQSEMIAAIDGLSYSEQTRAGSVLAAGPGVPASERGAAPIGRGIAGIIAARPSQILGKFQMIVSGR